ncbi:HAMP domain-containing protein [Ramlibacter sp. G-1-2-2]|uniref:HAMP domain-containing protein n=1 Tax=Ramlibacter agri TaxID=2728837 RepID=A0A848H346_9BURK|nr:methyl-accepting chemotaxis protein [Ramlibacter agri]NML44994.1 HAMP domain-containing protein [Ramlibacter agri]
MNAQGMAMPLPASVPAAQVRQRTDLSTRVGAAFAVVLLLQAALTALAVGQLQGAAATWALVLGVAGLLAVLATAAWLLRRLVGPMRPATAAMQSLAGGDLAVPIDLAASGELLPLMEALQDVREKLFNVVGEVRTGTGNVALNAAQISRDNQALAQRTETQADSLQETAASIEELTAAVRQNAGTTQQAHALVRTATERAEQGGAVMRQVVQTMESIRASSGSIRDIIGVIDGIAFQTNILALNAAVEAARAGEQGRGFAVVAAEVRMLAQRSAEAARDIKALIVGSVQTVDAGGSSVEEAGRAMAEIVAAVRQAADLIRQIDVASQEQSSGIENVNTAVARIDSTTQDNAAFVKGAARTAAALQERAVTLLKAVDGFQLGDREHGSLEEAVAMVQAGCDFQRAHGRQALLDDVNRLDAGRFIHRDLYLIALDLRTSLFVAHGNNPARLGKGPEVKDVDGKAFGLEMVRVARDRGEGWVDYKWVHPVTGEVFMKTAYVRREGDLAVGCTAYKH